MKISISKLKVAAIEFLPEFSEFAAQYSFYSKALWERNKAKPEEKETMITL